MVRIKYLMEKIWKYIVHLRNLPSIIHLVQESPYAPSSKSSTLFTTTHSLTASRDILVEVNKFAGNGLINNLNESNYFYEPNFFSEQITNLMDLYGSDKGSYHGYSKVYGFVFEQLAKSSINIAEVGIGSVNPKVPSNVGKKGKPGSSLRAWADMPNVGKIYGLDIDNSIMVNYGNISSFYLDQTDPKSFEKLRSNIPQKSVDLFIDDGLHSPYANLCFLNNVHYFVKPSGYIIIEDIDEKSKLFWEMLLNIPQQTWQLSLVKCNKKFAIVGKNLR
jgi:hypothetical protein